MRKASRLPRTKRRKKKWTNCLCPKSRCNSFRAASRRRSKPSVPVIGLTGGVATGKSTFARRLLSEMPELEHFDSDECVHDLLSTDDSVRNAIVELFGSQAL